MSQLKMVGMLLIFLGSVFVFFRRINVFPLRNWDEAWYAQTSNNMALGKYGYVMQFWNGRYYFDHSPLYFWLSAPFFKLFGQGEWQARIVSTIAAVFCCVFLYLIGKKLVSWRFGALSVLIFLTFGGVVIRFAHGNLDSLLVCLFLASFYFFLRSEENKVYTFLCGLAIGLGILVKSWGIGLFPVYLILVYCIFVYRTVPKRFLLSLLIAIFSFSWWYVLGISSFGNEFIRWFILNPSENRLDNPVANFSFAYIVFFLNDIGAWILPMFALVTLKTKDTHGKFVVPFLFVSLTYIFALNFLSDKSGWYIIPALPLVSMVIGYSMEKIAKYNFKVFLVGFVLLVMFGYLNALRIENIYPDRSRIGAELGVKASELIPKDAEVVLDDHDFTAFLFYSGREQVYTIQTDGKPQEWWILEPDQVDRFLGENKKSWVVTREPGKFSGLKEDSSLNGYSFLRNY